MWILVDDELPSVDHGPLNEGPWEKVVLSPNERTLDLTLQPRSFKHNKSEDCAE